MTDQGKERAAEALPRAVVRESRRISIVWLIPVVAALSGGFLAWKAINEKGPTITIVFDSAEGLGSEKTKIRYRDVEVGVVESIGFNEDLSKVEPVYETLPGFAGPVDECKSIAELPANAQAYLTFISEYLGEVINQDEFRRRMETMRINRERFVSSSNSSSLLKTHLFDASRNYYFLWLDKERMIDAGEVEEDAVTVLYESERFPPVTIGHAHNLAPELRAALDAGASISAADVTLPLPTMALESDPSTVLAQIVVQAEVSTDAEAETVSGDAAQPEVITEKKAEDDA